MKVKQRILGLATNKCGQTGEKEIKRNLEVPSIAQVNALFHKNVNTDNKQ